MKNTGGNSASIPTQSVVLGPNGLPMLPPPPLPPTPLAPPPPLDPGMYGPYGKDGMFEVYSGGDMRIVIAKRTPEGIIVRDYQSPDEKGVFTAIANAEDFHRLDAPDGSRSGYYQAGNAIYVFSYDAMFSKRALLPSLTHVADAEHFTLIPGLDTRIAKDATHVYLDGIPDSAIDAKTLSIIPGHPSVFQDAFHVYHTDGGRPFYTITPFEPPINFFSQPTQEPWHEFIGYVADKNAAYFQGKKIVGADLKTFAVFTTPKLHQIKESGVIYSYAKDRTYVYYKGTIVPDADPATFVPLTNGGAFTHYYGKDTATVYEGAAVIPELDPNTVQILWSPIYEGCDKSHFIKDNKRVFFKQTLLPGADAATFESLTSGDYGRDKNGIWQGSQFRADLPKDFQPVCNYG